MAKTIYITEAQQEQIRQYVLREEKEILFNSFQNALKSFLSELLTHPAEPRYPEFFGQIGVQQDELVKKMEDLGLITKSQKLTDNGESAKMDVQYTVPRQNFRTKALKLYDDLCNKETLDECDCAGAGGGDAGGSCFGGDAGNGFNAGVTSTETCGDYQYTVPFVPKKKGKKKDPSMIHRNLTTGATSK